MSTLSITGVAIGTMAMVVTVSVMNGFHSTMLERILGINAHVVSLAQEHPSMKELQEESSALLETEDVKDASPFIYTQILLRNRDYAAGVVLKGIDVKSASRQNALGKYISSGSLGDLEGDGKILIGSEVAANLGLAVGDKFVAILPFSSKQPSPGVMGMLLPEFKEFQVSGIFTSGMYEYDNGLCFVSLETAYSFLGTGGQPGIEIWARDFSKARALAQKIQMQLGYGWWVRSWDTMNSSLFNALKLEKITMFLLLVLIVIVASLNIISSLVVQGIEKTRDVGILKALGSTNMEIKKIFLSQGLWTGIVGAAIGGTAGLLLCFILDHWHFVHLPQDVYSLSTLPVQTNPTDIIIIVVVAIGISILASFWPATRISRIDPSQALRYE
jgi:lipoprotein-releasing system permease protein